MQRSFLNVKVWDKIEEVFRKFQNGYEADPFQVLFIKDRADAFVDAVYNVDSFFSNVSMLRHIGGAMYDRVNTEEAQSRIMKIYQTADECYSSATDLFGERAEPLKNVFIKIVWTLDDFYKRNHDGEKKGFSYKGSMPITEALD